MEEDKDAVIVEESADKISLSIEQKALAHTLMKRKISNRKPSGEGGQRRTSITIKKRNKRDSIKLTKAREMLYNNLKEKVYTSTEGDILSTYVPDTVSILKTRVIAEDEEEREEMKDNNMSIEALGLKKKKIPLHKHTDSFRLNKGIFISL